MDSSFFSDLGQAVLLGVVEGLTEFLPISSTAHIRLTQALLGFNLHDEFWKTFAIVIQLGAILSVVQFYRSKLVRESRLTVESLRSGARLKTLAEKVFVAFWVTAIPSFLLSKWIGESLESLTIIGASLVCGGGVMLWVDRRTQNERTLEELTVGQAILIGAFQILAAVFPGTSRSMSTIVAGQICGLSRSAALEFSFFLAIPTLLAATLYGLLKALKNGPLTSHQWVLLLIGMAVSWLVAHAVIRGLLDWVKRHSFFAFGIYRILLGLVVFKALMS